MLAPVSVKFGGVMWSSTICFVALAFCPYFFTLLTTYWRHFGFNMVSILEVFGPILEVPGDPFTYGKLPTVPCGLVGLAKRLQLRGWI